ncbi:RagB/SusD family nutrient uptake outer membrane protein [Bacteroides congonensis]
MKRNLFITCLISTVLTFSACDSYLDIVPKGESTLNKTSDYIGMLETPYGFPLGNEWYLCGEYAPAYVEEIGNYTHPVLSACFLWDENYDRAAYMTSTGSDDMYTMCYEKISRYNIIIDNISDAEGSDADKVMGIAQAKILRAYNYFFLINTYAKPYDPATANQERGIILRKEFSLEEEGVQGTVEDAYRLIQQDIEDAIPNLPHKAISTFHPDKSFGYALKAKVHLFKREIDQALQSSLDCIKEAEGAANHKLWNMNADYRNLLDKYKNYMGMGMMPDMMFEYGMDMYNMLRMMGIMLYFEHGYEDPENLLYQHGLNFMSPQAALVRKPVLDLFDKKTDLRYTFAMGTTSDGPSTAEPGCTFINVMSFRWNCAGLKLSEVYLMAAECYARKGDMANTVKYLNDLRKNRIINTYYRDLPEPADIAAAMKIVREERKRELLFTSNGFFDMRRFCTEFNETLTREFENNTYTLKPTSHLLTFPFPVAAMQNSNLIQNSK